MNELRLDGSVAVGGLLVDVAISVGPGETLGVLGPNGAGKTTLLRALAGHQRLRTGRLRLGETVLDDPAEGTFVPPWSRSVGVVFQELVLFEHLDVLDNVAFGLRAAGSSRAAGRHEARVWLDRLGLSELAGSRPAQLSGGEAQRVALARALAPRPTVLLLDEPLAALDAEVRASLRRQLRAGLEGHPGPRVLVTHDPLDAAVLADRVVVLEAGRITASGRLDDLVARPATAWAAELAGTNLLPATAVGVHLQLDGAGVLTCARRPAEPEVLVAIRPASVSLHRHRPEGSPRNVWAATVAEVEGFAERVRVRLGGEIPVVAEVTRAAVDELDLRPGREVWASVKASDVVAYPR